MAERELVAGEILAHRVLAALAVREGSTPDLAEVADQRQRAVTLLANAWDEVCRGVGYWRWDEGDAEQIAPMLDGSTYLSGPEDRRGLAPLAPPPSNALAAHPPDRDPFAR
jgi:hypothetical protein